ncbi:hypothetical protein [Maledivibacter halophilus]|uniref:Uncharacterized protein n=1 Tax=Maledivibacter halophilus TaxID=36842 RepID=A0A1T5LCZ2_9FIRM|nr:hypothetical protein [Maledivibacter halophilus]SKC73897.1 hypothetical protein SAMN02194393_02785 [Maledivibacter halophilus]
MNKKKIFNIFVYILLISMLIYLVIDKHNLTNEVNVSNRNHQSLVEDLNKEIESKENTIKELNEIIKRKDTIIEKLPKLDALMLDNLKDKGIDDPIKIKKDLMNHPELIPYEGSLGGTMSFFSIEDIYVLTDKWIFAYFEDGHTLGYMLLRYEIINEKENDIKIKWKVLDSYIFE